MPSLQDDMLVALEEDVFHDVTLVGIGGEEVPATKAILAIRSPVFRRMFFGNFQERTSDRVSLNYPAVVLKVLVKYCYTDELDLDLLYLDEEAPASGANPNPGRGVSDPESRSPSNDAGDCGLTDEEAVWMIQLRDAANYLEFYDIPEHLEVLPPTKKIKIMFE